MNILFENKPTLFGKYHILSLVLIVLFNIIFYYFVRNKKEKTLLNILNKLGLLMIISEVFKQWFCFKYVFDSQINLWFFPFQVCSLAMYFAFILVYLKEDKQNIILVFLATYSIFTDIMALIVPLDMLRIQVPLFIHSFAYHGLIISIAIMAILILKKRNNYNFRNSIYLFFFMAFIAEIINITSHLLFNDINREPNMFYITPFFKTTQPILSDIADRYGIIPEIIIYLFGITLVSYGLYNLILKNKNHILNKH